MTFLRVGNLRGVPAIPHSKQMFKVAHGVGSDRAQLENDSTLTSRNRSSGQRSYSSLATLRRHAMLRPPPCAASQARLLSQTQCTHLRGLPTEGRHHGEMSLLWDGLTSSVALISATDFPGFALISP